MVGKYKYKNKLIENVPYKSESRWFICELDGTVSKFESGLKIHPTATLKEAKKIVDMLERVQNTPYTHFSRE